MGRTLFVGDSHSMGYIDPHADDESSPFYIWQSNSYAESYSKCNNKKATIMASSGCGNREYVNFIANAFKIYDDIDEVFVQSTYWGRFPLAMNPSLDETDIFPLDFFLEKNKSNELIDRYSVGLVQQNKFLQNYTKPSASDFEAPYIKETSPTMLPSLTRSGYMYIQTYHYLQTHLAQQDYFRDILLCDTLCTHNNVKMYLWNINDRCFIPKETASFYSQLQSTTIADIDAASYIQQNLKINIENEKADSEHYNEYAHSLIASEYITYLKTLQNNRTDYV
tara:strand:- start:3682 stop:4521 length:840 start_codon:yes stop_codon:yes gene_type:complete